MNNFQVFLKPKALEDIDDVYQYISLTLQNIDAANHLVDELEQAIFSLEQFPFRGSKRKIGMFANKGYRQIFLDNFTIIYRVDIKTKKVIIVHVVYSKRNI